MWLLFHKSAKTRRVDDGEAFVQQCPTCNRKATFHEVEIIENLGVFFIDVIGDSERAFRCGACGDIFDAKGSEHEEEAPPAKSAAVLEREARVAEQCRLASEQQRREVAEAKAVRIDDELAELKKRMGR